MADEPELLSAVEPEPPAIETESEVANELETATEGEEVEQTEEDDLEEFDWQGRKIKAPKGLKDGVLMHADYTKKTQEIAEARRELEAQRTQQTKATEEELAHRASLHHIAAELKRFPEGYDWSAYQQHRQNDPLGADEAWQYFQHLRSQKGEMQGKISQAEQGRTVAAQQEIAKRLQETADHAKANIKGWTPETDKQVIDFALSKGITRDDLQRQMSPQVYEMLWLARIGSESLSRAASAPKPKPQTPAAPLTIVGQRSNPPARKSLSDMSIEEHAAYYQKQKAAGVVK